MFFQKYILLFGNVEDCALIDFFKLLSYNFVSIKQFEHTGYCQQYYRQLLQRRRKSCHPKFQIVVQNYIRLTGLTFDDIFIFHNGNHVASLIQGVQESIAYNVNSGVNITAYSCSILSSMTSDTRPRYA